MHCGKTVTPPLVGVSAAAKMKVIKTLSKPREELSRKGPG